MECTYLDGGRALHAGGLNFIAFMNVYEKNQAFLILVYISKLSLLL